MGTFDNLGGTFDNLGALLAIGALLIIPGGAFLAISDFRLHLQIGALLAIGALLIISGGTVDLACSAICCPANDYSYGHV